MELKKAVAFIEYVNDNIQSIGIEPYGTGKISEKKFNDLIISRLGRSCCFYFATGRPEIIIVDTAAHREVLRIFGATGGDIYGGMNISFVIKAFMIDQKLYLNKIEIGHIQSDNHIKLYNDYVYVITGDCLKKYDYTGTEIWKTPLIVEGEGPQTVQSFKIYGYVRPDETYPGGLIGTEYVGEIRMYREKTGIFFDKVYMRLKKSSSYSL